MNRTRLAALTSRALLRLYPRAWRERYGDEFLAVLEARPMTSAVVVDSLRLAVRERVKSTVLRTLGGSSDEQQRTLRRLARNTAGRMVAVTAGAATACAIQVWLGGRPSPFFAASTWTAGFVLSLIAGLIEVLAAARLASGLVVRILRRPGPHDAITEWLLAVAVTVVVGLVALFPPIAFWSAPLRLVNSALGPNRMIWMLAAQAGLGTNLMNLGRSRGRSVREPQ